MLRYPLKTVLLPAAWQPVLACLEGGAWTPLEKIHTTVPHIPAEQIESFLNRLSRKGYLTQRGFALLAEADYPRVSVIIPVRDRAAEITTCLNSLINLDYPIAKLEIIVVDDASSDSTPDAVAMFPEVRLLRMPRHRQVSFCRNRAAEIARGDILAFIDSDCTATATWLKELVPAFRDRSIGAVGGWVDAASQKSALDRYEKVKSSLNIGTTFKRSKDAQRFFYMPTCNLLVRRDAFLRIGGFRESLHVGEDVDCCWRLQDAGYVLEYRPMGKVAHKHRNRLAAFCARRFDYGTSEPVLQDLHADRIKTLYLPWFESLFWLSLGFAIGLDTVLGLFIAIGVFLTDSAKRIIKLKGRDLPITRMAVCMAVLRGYLTFGLNCCNFISRYYLIFVPVVMLLSPPVAAMLVAMHLAAGMVEYAIKKPRLNPFAFIGFFTLEQTSYQSGVWWACIQQFNFNPVLPRIVHKRL
jgi:mycofactocin system glycosyltransferase